MTTYICAHATTCVNQPNYNNITCYIFLSLSIICRGCSTTQECTVHGTTDLYSGSPLEVIIITLFITCPYTQLTHLYIYSCTYQQLQVGGNYPAGMAVKAYCCPAHDYANDDTVQADYQYICNSSMRGYDNMSYLMYSMIIILLTSLYYMSVC